MGEMQRSFTLSRSRKNNKQSLAATRPLSSQPLKRSFLSPPRRPGGLHTHLQVLYKNQNTELSSADAPDRLDIL